MNALPSKQELLDFQARWMRRAGICAILGAFLLAVSFPLQPVHAGDSDAEQLARFHEHATRGIISQGILTGIAFLLFTPLLYVLIKSARGRTERVRRGMVPFAFIGPVLFALSSFALAAGLSDVSGKFVDQLPAKERQARQRAAVAQAAAAKGKSGKQTNKPSAASKSPTSTTTTATGGVTTTAPTTAQPTTTAPRTPAQAASDAREDLAKHLIDNAGLLRFGSLLRLPALFALVFAMIYIPLWALRTGLLTRFWATLGMAFGVSLLLIPFGVFGLVLWFAVIGLMLAGWWIRPLPPAWAAGEAIPWPRPGKDIGPPLEERGPSDTVEGSAREISEASTAENGGPAPAPEQPRDETQGQRRKKRKRRK